MDDSKYKRKYSRCFSRQVSKSGRLFRFSELDGFLMTGTKVGSAKSGTELAPKLNLKINGTFQVLTIQMSREEKDKVAKYFLRLPSEHCTQTHLGSWDCQD